MKSRYHILTPSSDSIDFATRDTAIFRAVKLSKKSPGYFKVYDRSDNTCPGLAENGLWYWYVQCAKCKNLEPAKSWCSSCGSVGEKLEQASVAVM